MTFHSQSSSKVITNQLGYRNAHAKKIVLIPDLAEARGIMGDAIFNVMELNDFSKYGLNDPQQRPFVYRAALKPISTDFGPWLQGDFSHERRSGIYQAFCGNTLGATFAIRDDVWLRVLPECLRYFQIQSCGRHVPGWHEACHLDDGYIRELDRYVDAAGGWHDAGDFRKWATSTSLNAIALLLGHRLWGGREAELGLEPGILLREALQGVHYFLNIQDAASGALLQNIGGGRDVAHDNLDNRFTDNIPRSGDERRIWPTPWAKPAGKFTTLFMLYANALKACDPALAERCHYAARESIRFDLRCDMHNADHLQWRAWGYLECWRWSQSEEDLSAAISSLHELLDLQVTEYIGGQQAVRGFFRSEQGVETYHRKHIGASYPIWVLAEFIESLPQHRDCSRWRDAVAMWVDDYAHPFAARNPFGLLPYALYSAPSPEHPECQYRQLGESLYFRYFTAKGKFGINARNCLNAVAFAAAARVLNRPELQDDGYRLLEWILGNNPFQMSTMNGVGVLQPCALSFLMGNIPGGVTFGIVGDDADQPAYGDPWAANDEYYGYQTSQFLWALLALQTISGQHT